MAVRFTAESQTYSRTVTLGSQSAYSMTCWVKVAVDRNEFSSAWCLGNAAGGDVFSILQTTATGTNLEFITSAAFTAVPLVNMTVGTWYFVGISMNGATGTAVYRTAASGTFTTVPIASQGAIVQTTIQLGRSIYAGEWLNGSITGVKWWSATLTETELKDEAPYLAPVRTSNIRAYYKLLTPSTTDDSGNGMTLTGGTGAVSDTGPTGVTENPSGAAHSGGAGVSIAVTVAGAGSLGVSGGSAVSVVATVAGAGSPGLSGGAQTVITATSAGGGSPAVQAGTGANVTATSAGSGTPATSGGSGGSTAITAAGAGTPGLSAGSATSVAIVTAGAGDLGVAGGSATLVTIIAVGGGQVVIVDISVTIGLSRVFERVTAGPTRASTSIGVTRLSRTIATSRIRESVEIGVSTVRERGTVGPSRQAVVGASRTGASVEPSRVQRGE
jgi:hypothetical protein